MYFEDKKQYKKSTRKFWESKF